MLKRTITSVIGLPILAAFLILGGTPLKILVFIVIAIGMYEVYSALSGNKLTIHYAGFAFAGVYLFYIDNLNNTNIMTIILISFTLCALTLLVIFHKKITVAEIEQTLFGFFYVTVLLSTLYLVRESQHGQALVWLILITAWGSDTGAYLIGHWIGRHKMIPTLSAGKTWEGAIGGVITAAVLSVAYGVAYGMAYHKFDIGDGGGSAARMLIFAVAGVLGGIFSIFGDLTASAIKRYTKIKDFGKLLPGHGGVLDRFDSVLFTSPAVFLVILVFYR